MSRIGQKPVTVPEGVDLQVNGQEVKAKGSKGELVMTVHSDVSVELNDGVVTLAARNDSRIAQQVWPTMRTLVNNICVGVSEGYSKDLEIRGVGLRANMQGKKLNMTLGFSHDVNYDVPEGVKVEVADQTKIKVSGIDKQLVGQVAANIRAFKKPEPYKGKGIRYVDEFVLKKEGKKK